MNTRVLLIAFVLLSAACAQSLVRHERAAAPQEGYTAAEIARHASENDCWLVIRGKAYDVTKFIPSHPGGRAILEGCGKDATVLFETRPMGSGKPHSWWAKLRARKYFIGASAEARP